MRSREVIAGSRHPLIASMFIAIAIVLGGGGNPSPGMEVLLQLAFVTAGLAWLWVPSTMRPFPVPRARSFWVLAFLIVALPLIQLVPLPPELWTKLGGQENRVAALALVDAGQSWQPLSQFPARTLAALLAMIPALFAFFAAASLDARGRMWIVSTIAIMTLVAALLGAAQVSLGLSGPYLYGGNHPTLNGFQANRNAAADVLMIGIVANAAFFMPSLFARGTRGSKSPGYAVFADRRTAGIVLAALIAVLFFATMLTASRAGIVLLPLALVGVWAILYPALADYGRLRFLPAIAAVVAVPLAALAAWQTGNTALGAVASRFFVSDVSRLELWRDAWYATAQAWPFGVGVGGAQPAMIAAERLEVLDQSFPNRVHNDYLEFALEGGLLAIVVLLAIFVLLVVAAWRSWRDRPEERHLTKLGMVILILAAAHSLVDYPLRSMALACLIATGAGLLMSTPRRPAAIEPSA
jgi:O-antigen ligase